MKFQIIFLIVALAGQTFSRHYVGLQGDFHEIAEVLPLQKLARIGLAYMHDIQVQKLLTYIYGPDFKSLILEIESYPEFKDFIYYLESVGVPAKIWTEMYHELVSVPVAFKAGIDKGGLKAMCLEMKSIVNWHELEAFYDLKLESSPHFHDFIAKINELQFKRFVAKLEFNPRIIAIKLQLDKAGVDIDEWAKRIKDKVYHYKTGLSL